MAEDPRTAERSRIRAALDGVTVEAMRQSARIKWQRDGPEVLPAWVADMDFPVAPPIAEALAELVARSDFGYHRLPYDPRLRAAFCDRMAARYGWQIEPWQVFALVNVVQGLDAAVALYTRPGDGVVIQTPNYPPFQAAVDRQGRRRLDNPLVRGAERFEIDFDQLRGSLRSGARLLLLCTPHNPTGRVFERRELDQLAALALEHDTIVVADEIHADLVYPGHTHVPFATLSPELAKRTVTLTSATKAWNLAGLPIALAIFGDRALKQPWKQLAPHLLGHSGILDTEATCAAWRHGGIWLEERLGYLDGNRRLLTERLAAELPAVVHSPSEGTYLAWLDCRALALGFPPHQFFLERARVALSPGPDFGPPGEGFVRLNFATSRRILEEILDRMVAAVRAG